jgi:hypothetical protein
MAVIGMVTGIVILAVLDAVNTMRLHRKDGRAIRRELREGLRKDLDQLREQRDRGGS